MIIGNGSNCFLVTVKNNCNHFGGFDYNGFFVFNPR